VQSFDHASLSPSLHCHPCNSLHLAKKMVAQAIIDGVSTTGTALAFIMFSAQVCGCTQMPSNKSPFVCHSTFCVLMYTKHQLALQPRGLAACNTTAKTTTKLTSTLLLRFPCTYAVACHVPSDFQDQIGELTFAPLASAFTPTPTPKHHHSSHSLVVTHSLTHKPYPHFLVSLPCHPSSLSFPTCRSRRFPYCLLSVKLETLSRGCRMLSKMATLPCCASMQLAAALQWCI
jgi:hypothetical protein